jgi:hypothetical protein
VRDADRSPFPLNRDLIVFDPSRFDSHYELIAALWSVGVGAVAEIGVPQPVPWKPQVPEFGVPWVTLGPASDQVWSRLAVGCHRFRLAVATGDRASLERHLGAHPLFRQVGTVALEQVVSVTAAAD